MLADILIAEKGQDLSIDDLTEISKKFIPNEISILIESMQELSTNMKEHSDVLGVYLKVQNDKMVNDQWLLYLKSQYDKRVRASEKVAKMKWFLTVHEELMNQEYDFTRTPCPLTEEENEQLVYILIRYANSELLENLLTAKVLKSTIDSIEMAECLNSPLLGILKNKLVN